MWIERMWLEIMNFKGYLIREKYEKSEKKEHTFFNRQLCSYYMWGPL